MNHSFNRDIRYSFYRRCANPIHTWKIDDDWIKEKNIEMDIILPFKNIDVIDEENLKASDTNKKWNDIEIEELLKRQLDRGDLQIK